VTQQQNIGPELELISVSVKEAARRLGITPWTIYRMLDSGELEEMRVRGRRLVTYRSLKGLLPDLPEGVAW